MELFLNFERCNLFSPRELIDTLFFLFSTNCSIETSVPQYGEMEVEHRSLLTTVDLQICALLENMNIGKATS